MSTPLSKDFSKLGFALAFLSPFSGLLWIGWGGWTDLSMARIRGRPELWTTLCRQNDITVALGAWGNSGESQRSYGRSRPGQTQPGDRPGSRTYTKTGPSALQELMELIQGSPGVWLDYPKFSAVSSGFNHGPQDPCSRFPAGRLQRHTVSTVCLIYRVKASPRCGYRYTEVRRGLKGSNPPYASV